MQVSLTYPAGTYGEPLLVEWNTTPQVDFVMFTVNGLMPTYSEYVAYDTLNPPNPFIAVTQDGRGNVVYDGGFPKFYNVGAPAEGTVFAGLTGAYKYLYNALNFVANQTKKAAGNNKVLILGDQVEGQNYSVKGSESTSFRTSFTRLFAIAGYVPTFKDRSDYGDVLNPTLSELESYCAVLVMSSDYGTPTGRFTDAAVAAMVAYREAGSGVILITDHGPDLPDVNAAANNAYTGFFRSANQIASEYGVYFTGLFDRTPVNVGFLRTNYGDHPLYANLDNSESIHAGASESRVVVADYRRYKPGELPSVRMTEGCYLVQILTRLKTGAVEIQRQNICIEKQVMRVRKLYVRESSTSPWIINFSKGGWCVYQQGKAIIMSPKNTKMWDAKLKEWVGVK